MNEGSPVAVSSSLVAVPRLLSAVASLVVAPGSSMWASVGVVHWLSCSVACGIFPD